LSEIGVTPDQYTAIATGAGPSAVAALRTGKIDALVMWDAMLGAAENTGLALRVVNIPLEDRMVGTTLATTKSFANTNAKELGGYCRAMTKGLVFTMTNRAAAIRIFWDEFPTTKSANLDDTTALKNGVHIMDRFLEMALQGQPEGSRLGEFITELAEHACRLYQAGHAERYRSCDRLLHAAVFGCLQRLRSCCCRGAGEKHDPIDRTRSLMPQKSGNRHFLC